MPDEDAAVATEEAPTTLETREAEAPKEEPKEEAVPPPGQEQADTADSGDQEAEDEASPDSVDDAFLERLAEVRKNNPELAAKIDKQSTKPTEDVGEERLAWELERSTADSTATWNQVTQIAQQSQANASAEMIGVLDQLNGLMLEAATDLHEGKIEDPNRLQVDSGAWAKEHFMPVIARAQNAAFTKGKADEQRQVESVVVASDAYRYLTREERGQSRAAFKAGRSDFAVTLLIKAALRSSDKHAINEAKVAAEAKAGVADKMGKVFDGLGTNGKKSSGGGGGKSGPQTLEEIDEALTNGPTDAIDGLLIKRAALVE